MTILEIAADAEKAVDALTIALNDQPSEDPEVAERLKGIVHGVMLTLTAIAAGANTATAEQAEAAGDALLASMPALSDLADAMREDEDRRTIAA
jgi:hypothetical protein